MVGVGGASPANQTRLRCNEFEVGFVAMAARLADHKYTLVDLGGSGGVRHPFWSDAGRMISAEHAQLEEKRQPNPKLGWFWQNQNHRLGSRQRPAVFALVELGLFWQRARRRSADRFKYFRSFHQFSCPQPEHQSM
jgi:hypothetical protein